MSKDVLDEAFEELKEGAPSGAPSDHDDRLAKLKAFINSDGDDPIEEDNVHSDDRSYTAEKLAEMVKALGDAAVKVGAFRWDKFKKRNRSDDQVRSTIEELTKKHGTTKVFEWVYEWKGGR